LDSHKPRILLVDDDVLNRRMMELLLSEKGYNYGTASNGIEAITAVQSQSFDIVLMDLQMPLMDGFEATRKIREWEAANNHIPIVALTAMLFDDEIQKCLSSGMDDCIAKPFSTEQLFQLIDSYANKSKQSTSAIKLQEVEDGDETIVLDVQGALPRFSNDIQVYREFLDEFIEDLPERMKRFRTVFLSHDYETLADGAHNLKGISASMGAKQLSHSSHLLDQASQKGDLLLIQQALEDMEKHVPVLQETAIKFLSE
jgi:CheY-like chemotaxis protein